MIDARRYKVKRQYLTLSSDSSVVNAAGVDYSSTPARFICKPIDSSSFMPQEMLIIIEDTDTDYNKFGNLSALTNGLRVFIENSTYEQKLDLLNGQTIKQITDIYRVGGHVEVLNDSTGATRTTMIKIPLYVGDCTVKSFGSERVSVLLSDDLSALPGLYFILDYEPLGGAFR
jgi:hypothetical protein